MIVSLSGRVGASARSDQLKVLGDRVLGRERRRHPRGRTPATPSRIVTLLLVALAPAAIVAGIVRDVRERGYVSIRTMFGVLSIYLLARMLFSFGFNVIQAISDDPFFRGGVNGEVSTFLCYSYTTLRRAQG
ncbi:MAG: hypothetical protein ACR2OC_13305 [Solirubrobacterales bacterium]